MVMNADGDVKNIARATVQGTEQSSLLTPDYSLTPPTAPVTIILVRPQSPGNIGSVARAMGNMGLHRLVLVAPERFPHAEARMMACGAEDLLQQAQIHATLDTAIAPCHWLVGTSARRREYRHAPLTPRAFAARLPMVTARHPQVGILFGPEDAGLTTAELDLCNELVVIPTVPHATSLNLAQAVLVLCYEILQSQYQPPCVSAPPVASVGEVEAMFAHLHAAFTIHGFSGEHAVLRGLMGLRRIFERAGLERRDVRLVRGIARQLAWALRHPRHVPDERPPADATPA